jgi:hypothetical protein
MWVEGRSGECIGPHRFSESVRHIRALSRATTTADPIRFHDSREIGSAGRVEHRTDTSALSSPSNAVAIHSVSLDPLDDGEGTTEELI